MIDALYKEIILKEKDTDFLLKEIPESKKKITLMCYYRKRLKWSLPRVGLKFNVSHQYVDRCCNDWSF